MRMPTSRRWFTLLPSLPSLTAISLLYSPIVVDGLNTLPPVKSSLAWSASLFHAFPLRTKSSFLTKKASNALPLHMSPPSASPSSPAGTFIGAVSAAASAAIGRTVELVATSGGGPSGGGGATTGALSDTLTGTKYFLKSARGGLAMLRAEYEGVRAIADTRTIQVPAPIAFGEHGPTNQAFALFEYLEFCGGGSQHELGAMLAKMHRHTSPDGRYGFTVDNTIGATFQPNLPWHGSWADFWDEHRLGHMLKLTGNAGYDSDKAQKLRAKTRELLSHEPAPSIVHGDLWGGNKGFCKKDGKVVPVIFDCAAYYGDREVDVAMSYLFGGFNNDFYNGYNSEWPLPEGHEKRKTVYNLYHILNHDVLFGGGYLNQARGMIEQILRY